MSEPEDAETWVEELPIEEAQTTTAIMDRVVHAVGGLIDPDVARWLAEETLWQTAALLADAGRVALPEVGTLERVDGPAGPALRAVASPALRRAGGAR